MRRGTLEHCRSGRGPRCPPTQATWLTRIERHAPQRYAQLRRHFDTVRNFGFACLDRAPSTCDEEGWSRSSDSPTELKLNFTHAAGKLHRRLVGYLAVSLNPVSWGRAQTRLSAPAPCTMVPHHLLSARLRASDCRQAYTICSVSLLPQLLYCLFFIRVPRVLLQVCHPHSVPHQPSRATVRVNREALSIRSPYALLVSSTLARRTAPSA